MNLFNSFLVIKRWPGASREYLNKGSQSIAIPTDSKKSETLETNIFMD
jgi:hypothetical protein